MNEAIKSLKIQLELLKMEYEEEKAAFNKISEKIGLTRLAEKGNAWLGIRVGKSYHNSLNQRVVELFRNPSGPYGEDDHNFEYGHPAVLFTVDRNDNEAPRIHFSATVSFVDRGRMVVAIPESADLSDRKSVV